MPTGIQSPPGARRRCEVVPPAVAGELLRLRLISLLAGRWDATVTTVIAGPGFGKSTALAQAIRHNHADPRGIDAWVSCEPGDEDAGRLAHAIVASLAAPLAGPDAVTAVVSALGHTSPIPVCLVVDDVHELPEGCSGLELLAQVVRRLPAHAHLVLAGRAARPLPLARLRAADRVLEVTHDELAFTDDEVGVLAARTGHDTAGFEAMAGWPALVRLAMAAPPGATRSFLWEEVVAGLSGRDRRALLALATLGTADASSLREVCGFDVDIEHLAATIPLVSHTGDGRVRAHDLWHETLDTILPANEVRATGRAALARLLARGSYTRAGFLAIRIGDGAALAASALALVRNTMAALPVDTAGAWLQAAPPDQRDRPELVLLDAALRHAVQHHDPGLEQLLDTALDGFRDHGDVEGEHVVLAMRLVLAFDRSDLAAIAEVVDTSKRLPAASEDPALRVLAPAAAAIEAYLLGEVERAAAILEGVSLAGVPITIASPLLRLRWHFLVFSGRADAAARLGRDTFVGASTPNAPLFEAVARWMSGDPSGFDGAEPEGLDQYESRGAAAILPFARDWFNHGIFTAMVWASAADRAVVARALRLLGAVGDDTSTARNAAPLAVARAASSIINHDEPSAIDAIASYLAEHPLTDRFGEVCLRRFLAIPYVCSPEARRFWDEERLGPAHRLQREVARAVVAARSGQLGPTTPVPTSAAVYTALPLTWSLELAARAHFARNPAGSGLTMWLVDRLGPIVEDELRRLVSSADTTVGRGAERLLRTIPFPPEQTTRIEVVGPLRLLVDGVAVDRPEQRRSRVRTLLALLVAFPSLGRARAMDLLWPDLTPADAASNLRVTLSHLRRLLEPGRGHGDSCYHLRVEGDHLRLAASNRLTVDAWDLDRHLRAAAAARGSGDLAQQADHLERAVGLWRGDPLTDLDPVPEMGTEVEHLRQRLVDATLTLGELRLAKGDTAGTLGCSERVLSVDPYTERALRLLIAAQLQRRDRLGTHAAVQRAVDSIGEIGLPPEQQTAILFRQARSALQGHVEPVAR